MSTIRFYSKVISTFDLVAASCNFYCRAPSGQVDSAISKFGIAENVRAAVEIASSSFPFNVTVISASGLVAAVN
jgi:putative component of membrane protein insertase Oxa1/YidC/SpoIIIJ protein YidD